MKFLLRSLIVLFVAIAFGVGLFYIVRALPTDPPNPIAETQRPSSPGTSTSPTPTPSQEKPKRDQGINPLRSILKLGQRVVMFSIMVFVAVIARNLIFERKPSRKKTPD